MALAARLYRTDTRQHDRYSVRLDATLRDEDFIPLDAVVLDLSRTGMRVWVEEKLGVGDPISVGLSGIGMVSARIAWCSGSEYGCELDRALTEAQIAAATSSRPTVHTPVRAGAAASPETRPELSIDWAEDEGEEEPLPNPVRFGSLAAVSLGLWASAAIGAVAFFR